MVAHHIQKKILRQLVLGRDRFSELQPTGIDSNLYNYHLHQLIAGNYVEKTSDNRYRLTELGKAEGINLNLNEHERLTQAHPILLLHVRDTDGRYLLRKRTVHPAFGKIGFIHCEPVANEPLKVTAGKIFLDRTGLHGNFQVGGSGFIRIFWQNELESFTNFTLLTTVIAPSELLKLSDESGKNFWSNNEAPDFSSVDMLPSMVDLVVEYDAHKNGYFFIDKTYRI